MEHSQSTWQSKRSLLKSRKERGPIQWAGQGKILEGWVGPTYLQMFSQTIPLLYSSVPSQQSEDRGRGTIRLSSVPSLHLLPFTPTPVGSHLPQTPSLTHLEEMYKDL